jgi:outer membrane protein TolC
VPPCLPRLSFYLTITALLGVGVGCTRSLYRKRADRESYSAIAAKSSMLPPELQLRDPVIEPDPESRFFSEFNPDHPPMPPDDPLSHHFMVRVAGKSGPSVWRANNPDDPDRDAAWRERLPKDASGAVELNLKSAMRLALLNSRDFQREREDLYLSALDVTYERFRFSPQYALGSTAGAQAANSMGASANQERASVLTDGSVRWLSSTGGQLLAGFANSFVWTFKGSESTEAAGSLVNFSILQPLLRLGGKERTLAALTQAERDLLANVRQMNQFQQGFYVRIASGRQSGEGPSRNGAIGANGLGIIALTPSGRTGAPRANGFYYILEEEQRIRNLESNVARLRESLDQLAAAFDAGRLSSRLQVDQARQALLNSQSLLLSARASYETQLDAYKVELGLPPNLPVVVRDPLLEKFRTTDPSATALDRKLVVLLAKIQNRDLAATQEELKEYLQDARNLAAALLKLIGASEADLTSLREVVPIRKQQLTTLVSSELARSLSVEPDRLDPNLLSQKVQQCADRCSISRKELKEFDESLSQFADEIDNLELEAARSKLVDLTNDLSGILLSVSLNQTAIRLETAVLPQIELSEDTALELARENRLDWMNARARLVDVWRTIGVQANALQSAVDFSLFGGLGTIHNQAARFDGRTGTLRGALRFDTPLNRLAERNDYREAQVNYERARREYMLFEDRISQSLRNTLRIVEISQLNFELRRSAIQIAISKVDLAKLRLQEPPKPGVQATIGATTARDLVDALNDLLDSQNDFLSLRVGFDVLRMLLDFEVGTMQTDEEGLWIDPGVITPSSLTARAPNWSEVSDSKSPATPQARQPKISPQTIPLRADPAPAVAQSPASAPAFRVSFKQAPPTVR